VKIHDTEPKAANRDEDIDEADERELGDGLGGGKRGVTPGGANATR